MHLYQFYRYLRNIISKRPHLYFFIGRFFKIKKFFINKNTDLVIEGFPRSGNSFLEACFKVLNKNIILAHHTHSVAQVKMGIKKNLPVILLIRDPSEATKSAYFFYKKKLSYNFLIKEYIGFYESLIIYKKNTIVLDFKKINNFKKILKYLQTNFDSLPEFDKTINNKNLKKKAIKKLINFSKTRHHRTFSESYINNNSTLSVNRKKFVIEQNILKDRANIKLLKKAKQIYQKFKSIN